MRKKELPQKKGKRKKGSLLRQDSRKKELPQKRPRQDLRRRNRQLRLLKHSVLKMSDLPKKRKDLKWRNSRLN